MISRPAPPALLLALLVASLTACTFGFEPLEGGTAAGGGAVPAGDTATVVGVIDGDTIDVVQNGVTYRVRYVGVNTPERDEICYGEATGANAALVAGRTVTLVRDQSETDRFGRLLRFVYADGVFVNAQLIREGWAEAVEYRPDTTQTGNFQALEREAAAQGRGCHPTGIFDDGTATR
jgi:endonuclease YncB( thermonuclease family)